MSGGQLFGGRWLKPVTHSRSSADLRIPQSNISRYIIGFICLHQRAVYLSSGIIYKTFYWIKNPLRFPYKKYRASHPLGIGFRNVIL